MAGNDRRRSLFQKLSLLLALLLVPAALLAGPPPNLTGQYQSEPAKPGAPPTTILKVVQTGSALTVTRTERGRTTTNRFILDGGEGPYTSPGGVAGKGRAKFAGSDLLIDSLVENKPKPNGPAVQVRIMEKWHISPDRKALTIAFEVAFPNMPGAQPQSWNESYTRSSRP
jgi:hypothetical protein